LNRSEEVAVTALASPDELIGERALSKLKWRCRRGLLENDLFIERFFKRFETSLTLVQAEALGELMDLSDNDLLDLHLARKPLEVVSPALDKPDVREVLSMLRETL
jgi:antitoxin CptB